jgi:tetratricopeptide (TPR) repeat protein
MTTGASSSKYDDLFFRTTIASYVDLDHNPRFLCRDWLADDVAERLKEPTCRFVLLTAEPGAGKSVFVAQLAKDNSDWPVYFVRRDQRTPLGDAGARSFLIRLGFQLAAIYPELFTNEQLTMRVEQLIGDVDSGGEVVGAKAKRILASPFCRKTIEISQRVTRNKGKITGIQIDELVADQWSLPIPDLQNMALIAPAREMAKSQPDAQIVILIDALDELRYHPTEDTILNWLTGCPELPGNVRFVLTSRPPDDALLAFCEKQQPYLHRLTIASEDERVQKDLQTYVKGLVTKEEVTAALEEKEKGVEAFARKAVARADGNIGYLDALARGIDQTSARKNVKALRELLTLQELPKEMEDLYAFFLRQIRTSVSKQRVEVEDPESGEWYDKPAWPAVYKPILGVLTIALEPLTPVQIVKLSGIKADFSYVTDAIDQLRQFMDLVDNCYRLYHATVPEFLTASRTQKQADTAAFYVNPMRWHKRIADYYRGQASSWEGVDWSQVDDYGLLHLTTHLYSLRNIEAYRTGLLALARDRDFEAMQRWRLPYVPDLVLNTAETALLVAAATDDAGAMAEFLLEHSRRFSQALAQTSPLKSLRADHLNEGLELADLRDIQESALWHLLLAWELAESGQSKDTQFILERLLTKEPARLLLWRGDHAAHMLTKLYDVDKVTFSALHKRLLRDDHRYAMCSNFISLGRSDVALEVVREFENSLLGEARVLSAIAAMQAEQGGFPAAVDAVRRMEELRAEAQEAIGSTQWQIGNLKTETIRGIAVAMACDGKPTDAIEMVGRISDEKARIEALGDIAAAQLELGWTDMAEATLAEAGRVMLDSSIPAYRREEALSALAVAHAHAFDFTSAIDTVRKLTGSGYKVQALVEIAQAQASAGKMEEARATFSDALHTARAVDVNSNHVLLKVIATALVQAGEFSVANDVAREISDAKARDAALEDIARDTVLARAKARQLTCEATREIDDDRLRTQALVTIAVKQAREEEFDSALETIENIHKETWWQKDQRAIALQEIALSHARLGRFAVASEVANKILAEMPEKLPLDFSFPWETTMGAIAMLQDKAGYTRDSRTTFANVLEAGSYLDHDSDARSQALRTIAVAQIETGAFADALEIAGQIDDEYYQVGVLLEIAVAHANNGQFGDARKCFASALEFTQRPKTPKRLADALIRIATRQVESGLAEEAHSTLVRALEAAKDPRVGTTRVINLTEIAVALAQAGYKNEAHRAFDLAVEGILESETMDEFIYPRLRSIIEAQLQVGEFSDAIENAHRIQPLGYQLAALGEVAVALAGVGQRDAAESIVEEILKSVWQLELPAEVRMQRIALQDPASFSPGDLMRLVNPGKPHQALRSVAVAKARLNYFTSALEIANGIDDAGEKSKALLTIGKLQAKAGHEKAARTVLSSSSESAGRIEASRERSKMLREIANEQANLGDITGAVQTAQRIEERDQQAITLAEVGEVLAQADRKAEAQTVFSSALDSARAARPSEQALIAIATAQARSDFGEQAITTAQMLISNRARSLPKIAEAFAESNDREHLIEMLIPCAYDPRTAYPMCGLLAKTYPEQAMAVAEMVREFRWAQRSADIAHRLADAGARRDVASNSDTATAARLTALE